MNMAVFFQKHDRSRLIALLKKIYFSIVLCTNHRRILYLRDAGATIGEHVTIADVSIVGTEACLVEIGNHVYFSGYETRIVTHDGSISLTYNMGIAPKRYDFFGKVKIGSNCFIGMRCLILKGVTIGDNCVIGAGAIVTKDIPSGSVACGVPARVLSTTTEYYKKNMDRLDDTIGWNTYRKRCYLEQKYNKTKM